MDFYAAIMAGGSGTRFWPASKRLLPKQFLSLEGSGKSLITRTSERLKQLIPDSRQLVITNINHIKLVREHLPGLPAENIVGEPVGRNTAPCLGVAALLVQAMSPDGVIAALPADHIVKNNELINRAFSAAAKRAHETGAIVTIGITPGRPETGYGYIESGGTETEIDSIKINSAKRFVEKPDLKTAEQYLASGRFFWNAGIFIFRADTLLNEIERQMPHLFMLLQKIKPSVGTKREFENALEKYYPQMKSVSIDYGVMEGAEKMEVIPLSPGWFDVGSWEALRDVMPLDENGNVNSGNNILIDCKDSVVYNQGGIVACVGLENITVVKTGDAVLVIPTSDSQRIREVVKKLKEEKENEKYS